MNIQIKSDAFEAGESIPVKFTGDGENISPPLEFEGLPPQTRELVLIVDDPDAPRDEPFVHWVMYKIPSEATGLPEGVPSDKKLKNPSEALQGTNSMNHIGYDGPAPPPGHGVHHYHFHLFALDERLELRPGLDKTTLLDAMAGHILDQADVIGTYER